MNNRAFSRRRFLTGLLGLGGLALVPGRQAGATLGERKFLFLFASGGWDTTYVFEPKFNTDGVDMDPMATLGTAGNLKYTRGDRWPSVERFFNSWYGRVALVNGINSHSVGHDSCAQFMLTGTAASSIPDWPTLLASNASRSYPLPHMVYSGPNFSGTSGATVVRGGGGTLLDLVDGGINGQADDPQPAIAFPSDQMIDAFVYERSRRFAERVTGQGRRQVDALLASLEQSSELEGRSFEAQLARTQGSFLDQALSALDVMRLGLARCAMISLGYSWDTHSMDAVQGDNFDAVFSDLHDLMTYMATTPGESNATLMDEVVLVVMSEMGRTPKLNGSNGKDHWPYTSVLLAGSGIRGNQLVGYTDDDLISMPIDFQTGLPQDSGIDVGAEHFGATLLKLGGLDPNQFLPGIPTVDAVLR